MVLTGGRARKVNKTPRQVGQEKMGIWKKMGWLARLKAKGEISGAAPLLLPGRISGKKKREKLAG